MIFIAVVKKSLILSIVLLLKFGSDMDFRLSTYAVNLDLLHRNGFSELNILGGYEKEGYCIWASTGRWSEHVVMRRASALTIKFIFSKLQARRSVTDNPFVLSCVNCEGELLPPYLRFRLMIYMRRQLYCLVVGIRSLTD